MNTKIVTFGEILLRISKPGYQRLFQGHRMNGNYGGSEANAAISLAYLGDKVEYVTRLPYGEIGDAALMHLREFGLNVKHVVRGGERLGTQALDANYEIDAEAYLTYFCKMHKLFPKCKKMVMAVRNQIASSHHTLSGLLYDAVENKLYTTRIYDIQPIIDPMGVGDAFVAAYIHAHQKWGDENQYCLDFALSASAIKNTVPGDQNLVSEEEIINNMTSSGGRIQR